MYAREQKLGADIALKCIVHGPRDDKAAVERKVEETTIASNNLQNLINSTDIGTIFLDRSLRVQLFTPAARDIFNLIPEDYGRPLSDITDRLEYAGLIADCEHVIERLKSVEREVATSDGKILLMRILPYRTSQDRINGVVVTFLDITALKSAEAGLRESQARMRLILDSAKDYAIFTTDMNRNIDTWNAGAEAMFGYTEAEILGRAGDILYTPDDRASEVPAAEHEKALTTGRAENERWHDRKDGSRSYGSGLVMPLRDDNGNAIGLVKIMRDLTREKQSQNELERFNRVAVGRETRMIELKKEVNELAMRLGEGSRYKLEFDDQREATDATS